MDTYNGTVTRERQSDGTTKVTFTCDRCKKRYAHTVPASGGALGFGVLNVGGTKRVVHCYKCCAATEVENMIETGRSSLYLIKNMDGSWDILDWGGELSFDVLHIREIRHNMVRDRCYWVSFVGPDGFIWSGRNLTGQILNVRRTKKRAR